MSYADDTIAAIATARGKAALAIVRMSGPRAVDIANRLFRGADLSSVASHTVHVGYFESEDGHALDQTVVTVFRSPRSVTGEDVVEVTCHGGDVASQLVLRALISEGARPAGPGEFTQRAYLNGKMDLAQAEAVADIIHGSSLLAHRVSLAHLEGKYSTAIEEARQELLHTCAMVELELDFTEEDVEFADRAVLARLLDQVDSLLSKLLQSYQLGRVLRDGVAVVIGGRPNAGKSTLLNALVRKDRAIVSPVPGTTRDEVEAEAELEGVRFRFTDTAGLRDTADAIEAEGVRRTRRAIGHADVLLYVFDLSAGLDEEERAFLEEIRKRHDGLSVVLVGNKADRAPAPKEDGFPEAFASVRISALEAAEQPERLAEVERLLLDAVGTHLADAGASRIVTNQRHRQHIERARTAVRSAARALDEGLTGDALSIDLREALHELGAITGEITSEDILSEIFANFCIGK